MSGGGRSAATLGRCRAAAVVLALAMFGAGAPVAGAATTITVNTPSDAPPNPSECSGVTADCSIRQAIDKAASGDTVAIPENASHYAIALGEIDLSSKDVTIRGGGARATVLDAGGAGHRIFSTDSTTVTIAGVTLTGAALPAGPFGAGAGGAIVMLGGTLTISDSAIRGNTAGRQGGGIAQGGGTLTIQRSTISGNQAASYGGGLDLEGGAATLVDTTIDGNHSDLNGGAFDQDLETVSLTNDTITHNSSGAGTDFSGGISNSGGTTTSARNTLVALNTTPSGMRDCVNPLTSLGHDIDSDGSCFAPGDGDATVLDPHVGPLADHGGPTDTVALLSGSAAIDAADNSGCPASDQRGVARPQPSGGVCDVGAFEARAPTAVTTSASNVTSSSATLNGTVDPGDLATSYHFEYGSTATYGASTPSGDAGSEGAEHPHSANLAALTPSTTYHFRIVAANAIGTTAGADQVFTTAANPQVLTAPGAPLAVTGAVSGVGSRTATLSGTVNPGGGPTSYHFDYGASVAYGQATPQGGAGSGSSPTTVSTAIAGLRPGAIYHYRLSATNSTGTSSGADRAFGTKARIVVAGLRAGGCVRASRATVRIRVTSLLRARLTITLDRKRIARSKRASLKLRLAPSRLRPGVHRLVVNAKSAAGTTRRAATLRVCHRSL